MKNEIWIQEQNDEILQDQFKQPFGYKRVEERYLGEHVYGCGYSISIWRVTNGEPGSRNWTSHICFEICSACRWRSRWASWGLAPTADVPSSCAMALSIGMSLESHWDQMILKIGHQNPCSTKPCQYLWSRGKIPQWTACSAKKNACVGNLTSSPVPVLCLCTATASRDAQSDDS